MAIFIVFTILPLVAVVLRVLARRSTGMKLWWDDWLIIVATALVIVQFAFLMEAIKFGLGQHVLAIDPTNVEPYLMYTYMSELYYAIDVTLIKCGILCLYLRIFRINKMFVYACYGLIGFVVVWGITTLFVTIFQCTPVEAAWDKTIVGLSCFNLEHFVIGTNVPNILADAAIIAVPIPLVWKLQISMTRRLGLVALFLMAAVTTIISIFRLSTNAHIDVTDPTFNFVLVAIFSTVEVNVGVVCACMPVIYPLFRVLVGRKIVPSTKPSAYGGSTGFSNPSRAQQFSKLGDESDTDHLWKTNPNSSHASTANPNSMDVPMGRIMVTRNLDSHSNV